MKYLLALPLTIILSSAAFCQNSSSSDMASILTTTGSTYRGQIVHESPDTVILLAKDGNTLTILRRNIASIDYHWQPINKFWELGAVFGTPAGLNLIAGYHFEMVGLRFGFGYWGSNLYGAEISIPITLYRGEHSTHDVAIVAWTSSIDAPETEYDYFGESYVTTVHKTFTGIGPAYQVNLNGFSGELGLAFGSGTFSSPQLMLQLGYVYQFR